MARLAAPLVNKGGAMFTLSYYGANKVVSNYNVMDPVKAALEASARYLAYELGPKGIRVHPVSPGPLKTRAASGLKDFDLLLNEAARRAPMGELVDIMDVAPAPFSPRRMRDGCRGDRLHRRRRAHHGLAGSHHLPHQRVAGQLTGKRVTEGACYPIRAWPSPPAPGSCPCR